jgi:outer membrane biosynthesis protein TonB
MDSSGKRNKRIAFAVTLGFHGLLLLLLFFLAAWRAPNPPLPEYGIELNFGLDDQGGGDIQPETPVSADVSTEKTEEKSEEASKPEEQQAEEIKEVKNEVPVVSKEESPVVVKEEKKLTESVKPKESEKPKKVESISKESEKTKETTASNTQQKSDVKKVGDNALSQGDDPGKVGDKGNPQGKLDAKALYGKQGGGANGDGFGLSMSGWAWADSPKTPDLPDNDDGRIEFEIECDADGEIVRITTLNRGLSIKAEQMLKEEIRRNSLVRTSAGKVPERSKGKVVFVLKTK